MDTPASVSIAKLFIDNAPMLLVALAAFIVSIRRVAKAEKKADEIKIAINGRLTQLLEATAKAAELRGQQTGFVAGTVAAKVQAE